MIDPCIQTIYINLLTNPSLYKYEIVGRKDDGSIIIQSYFNAYGQGFVKTIRFALLPVPKKY